MYPRGTYAPSGMRSITTGSKPRRRRSRASVMPTIPPPEITTFTERQCSEAPVPVARAARVGSRPAPPLPLVLPALLVGLLEHPHADHPLEEPSHAHLPLVPVSRRTGRP